MISEVFLTECIIIHLRRRGVEIDGNDTEVERFVVGRKGAVEVS